jgi:hypothetical protein
MILPLLLGLGLGYFALTVPYNHQSPLKEMLTTLAQSVDLSSRAKARVAKMTITIGDSSKTYNKTDIYLCTNKRDGTPFDNETILIAAIHELAHVICDEEGHTPEFNRIERALLDEAKRRSYISRGRVDPLYPCRL